MIYLGSDHAGWELKQEVKAMLQEAGQAFEDLGDAKLVPNDDYPDYAFKVGEAVAAHPGSFGILACGSAQGVCIAANKVKDVRAVAVHVKEQAARARHDDDANVLCLSGWDQDAAEARGVIDAFLQTPFAKDERYVRRIGKISAYESK